MLNSEDFISRGQIPTIGDEDFIDIIIPDMLFNGTLVTELFYCAEAFNDVAIDYGGGVYGLTCRDILYVCNSDTAILRQQLGLKNTRQANELCQDLVRICDEAIKRSGYLF